MTTVTDVISYYIFAENKSVLPKAMQKFKDYSRLPGLEVLQLYSYPTQLSMKFILLINFKMPTIVGILTFISRIDKGALKQEKSFIIHYFTF